MADNLQPNKNPLEEVGFHNLADLAEQAKALKAENQPTEFMNPEEMARAAGLQGVSGQTQLLEVNPNIERGAEIVDSVMSDLKSFLEKADSGSLEADQMLSEAALLRSKMRVLVGVAKRDQFPPHLRSTLADYMKRFATLTSQEADITALNLEMLWVEYHMREILDIWEKPGQGEVVLYTGNFQKMIQTVMAWFK